MLIFLIGFMGSGKTTIGKQLAHKLGYRFIDQDDVIEEHCGKSISEVFASVGEEKFRETEREVLRELCLNDNAVISTGGGAPCFFDNMEMMNRSGVTIYLKASPSVLMHRLKDTSSHRPLVNGKTESELTEYIIQKLAEREDFYLKAKYTVEALNLKVGDILGIVNFKVQ